MKKMAKGSLLIVLALSFVAVLGCKSQPANQTPQTTDDAFRSVYDRHFDDLILEGAGTHTVVTGDTLSAIARTYYYSGVYYPVIMLASKEIVLDPDRITPGMVLIVPDLQANLDNPGARANLKRFLGEIANIEQDRGRITDANNMRALADTL
ncbi:MAG: LysM peptidoglycan-binding domain-containing protein [Clostridia bacterium]|nr:LysM peptidoglycan-binding domain-containing protein [Clostridia bacterium]